MKRRALRKVILLMSLLIFPITLNYFSPYLVIRGKLGRSTDRKRVVVPLAVFHSPAFRPRLLRLAMSRRLAWRYMRRHTKQTNKT